MLTNQAKIEARNTTYADLIKKNRKRPMLIKEL